MSQARNEAAQSWANSQGTDLAFAGEDGLLVERVLPGGAVEAPKPGVPFGESGGLLLGAGWRERARRPGTDSAPAFVRSASVIVGLPVLDLLVPT